MRAVAATGGSAAVDTVRPSKDCDDGDVKTTAWIGPTHVGCCVLVVTGPLQLLFVFFALVAFIFLLIECARSGGFDWTRTIAGVTCIAVCVYLGWLSKTLYILEAFQKEIKTFRALNRRLRGEVEAMTQENREYAEKNAEQDKNNRSLQGKVQDLARVGGQLSILNNECKGNVEQAHQFLERLGRNIKLDTVNSVLLFFDRSDSDKNDCINVDEVGKFVHRLNFLWSGVPGVDLEVMKAAIIEEGGLSLKQVHPLVEAMLLEDTGDGPPTSLARRLQVAFKGAEACNRYVGEAGGPREAGNAAGESSSAGDAEDV